MEGSGRTARGSTGATAKSSQFHPRSKLLFAFLPSATAHPKLVAFITVNETVFFAAIATFHGAILSALLSKSVFKAPRKSVDPSIPPSISLRTHHNSDASHHCPPALVVFLSAYYVVV